MRKPDLTKKRLHPFLKAALIAFIFIFAVVGYGIHWAFFDMGGLPDGEFLTEETSPDGKYTVKTYVTNGGATTSYAVRGELVFNEKNDKSKNIYWNYREETADVVWKDKDTVVINGQELDVPNDTFDFRNQ